MQTRIDAKAKTARYQFASLRELEQWVEATPPTWNLTFARTERASDYWDLNAGYEGALTMARLGWIEGAQKAQEALKAFSPATAAPDTVTDFYGFRPHVPRFCAGAPDSMVRHAPVADMGVGKVLTLAVALDANAHTSAKCMANFGVAVAQYVNQLETDGMRVEVIGVLCASNVSGWRVSQSFTVKNADQPLDLAVMAFAIGHPAMLRRIGLSLLERSPAPQTSSYGSAAHVQLSDIINAPPGTVILNGMKDAAENAPTPEAGLKYVSKQIEAAIERNYNDAK